MPLGRARGAKADRKQGYLLFADSSLHSWGSCSPSPSWLQLHRLRDWFGDKGPSWGFTGREMQTHVSWVPADVSIEHMLLDGEKAVRTREYRAPPAPHNLWIP